MRTSAPSTWRTAAVFFRELHLQVGNGGVDQVQALIGRVVGQMVQLGGQGLKLGAEGGAFRVGGRLGGQHDTFHLHQDRFHRLQAGQRRLKRADALIDVGLTRRQVAGAILQRLVLEVRDRVVDGGADLQAGRQTGVGPVNEVAGILQRQQIAADGGGECDVGSHGNILSGFGLWSGSVKLFSRLTSRGPRAHSSG